MKPDRLKGWLTARPSGAKRLQLLHDSGLGSLVAVQSWSLEEIQHMDGATPTSPDALLASVEEAAIDHATTAGEPCKYSLQWQASNGNALKTTIHRAGPELDAEGKPLQAIGDAYNAQRLLSDFMGHIERQQKTMNASHAGALLAYEKALGMQQRLIDMLSARVLAMPDTAPVSIAQDNEEVQRLKAVALGKLIEFSPHIIQLAIGAIAKASGMLPAEGAAEGVAAAMNGAGHS